MGIALNKEKIRSLAAEIANDLKTPEGLSALSAQLTEITVKATLNAEPDHHLGYSIHDAKDRNAGNSRNSYSSKSLKGDHGTIETETPRDRNSSFDP